MKCLRGGRKTRNVFLTIDNWVSFTSLDTLSVSSGLIAQIVTSGLLILLFSHCVFFGPPSHLLISLFHSCAISRVYLCESFPPCLFKYFCCSLLFCNSHYAYVRQFDILSQCLDALFYAFFFHFSLDNFFYPIFKFTGSFLNCSSVCQ